jgi:hypothetical protein
LFSIFCKRKLLYGYTAGNKTAFIVVERMAEIPLRVYTFSYDEKIRFSLACAVALRCFSGFLQKAEPGGAGGRRLCP